MTFTEVLNTEEARSAILALVLYGLSGLVSSLVTKNQSNENKRFWALTFRHLAAVGFVLGMAIIWRKELQAVILALGAATAGFLIAFREHWQSLLAFWVRVIKRSYSLGDLVEMAGIRGRVIDITWLSTVIAETAPGHEGGAYTGRVIHIPNHKLLTEPLAVDNFTGIFGVHTVKLFLPDGVNPLVARDTLLRAAETHCEPYYLQAQAHMETLEREQALDTPSIRPRARIHVQEEGHILVTVRVVVPTKEKVRVEQSIIQTFFELSGNQAWPSETKRARKVKRKA